MCQRSLPHTALVLYSTGQKMTGKDTWAYRRTDRQYQVQLQPASTTVTHSVSHTHMHTLVCRQNVPTYFTPTAITYPSTADLQADYS